MMEEFQSRLRQCNEILIASAGEDPIKDAKLSSRIQTYREFLESELEA